MARRIRVIVVTAFLALLFVPTAGAAEPARSILNLNYNSDEIGAPEGLNNLDLYLPAETNGSQELKPVVVWVHGGGLMIGDKSNRMPPKVALFNDLGYLVASVNYRLSPDISDGDLSKAYGPMRVRAPDHIADVAEAIGWITRNISRYGGDPDRLILAGHSAGAYLVSLAGTSPAWLKGRRVSPDQILGVVALDSDMWNVKAEADPSTSTESPSRKAMLWHVFGTPEEEAAYPLWEAMSPLLTADPTDPPFLFVTQSARPARVASNSAAATALGQEPGTSVVGVPYDHEGINTMLGSETDSSQETPRVRQFTQEVVAAARPVGLRITRRPPSRVRIKVRRNASKATVRRLRRKVTFGFQGIGRSAGFQCRIDRGEFSVCGRTRSYRLKTGAHTFRVRPLYPSGRPGKERKIRFRISVCHPVCAG